MILITIIINMCWI